MAFVWSVPKSAFLARAPALTRTCRTRSSGARTPIRADTDGPVAPKDFVAPEPRIGYVKPSQLVDIATGAAAMIARAGAGTFIEGYRLSRRDGGGVTEESRTLPKSRPRLALRIFEFEACPFCRKVREAVSMLDLDVIFFPCPKGGTTYREYVAETGGKQQFPYLQDPNTGWCGYESSDIINYLYKTYGPQDGRPSPLLVSPVSTISAGVASALRPGKGSRRVARIVPAKRPVELYGYESSPFSKVVRERLVELEVPYLLRSTPRGSATRAKLKEITGRVQTPYLIDPNTGVSMFESAAIVEYLAATYGENAQGAVEKPSEEQVFLPAFVEGSDGLEEVLAKEPSLNPEQKADESLEKYCEDNPEADECRVYED